ncbi:hypothetical protein Pmani_040135 [Petrolisthes manimaculis]|uniref:Uncharacterized protein n=1 Tax=Petrolisthes manimaculis TaxID=1843537 RepID=A0AAE1TKL8_9EUCA|nr:hypothetical protein Pmani_040135 [Petrolisthes manimaculis]
MEKECQDGVREGLEVPRMEKECQGRKEGGSEREGVPRIGEECQGRKEGGREVGKKKRCQRWRISAKERIGMPEERGGGA